MTESKRTLSPREAECLRRVRALQSSDEIARDLDISTGTVNGYIRDAVFVLGARDRRHAALIFEGIERQGSQDDRDGTETMSSAADVPPAHVTRTPNVVRDSTANLFNDVPDNPATRIFREVLSGSRPEGWSMITRATLILVAVVVIGVAVLLLSASLGVVYGLVEALRAALR